MELDSLVFPDAESVGMSIESQAFGALEWAQFLQHMLPHLAQHFGLLAWDLQRQASNGFHRELAIAGWLNCLGFVFLYVIQCEY